MWCVCLSEPPNILVFLAYPNKRWSYTTDLFCEPESDLACVLERWILSLLLSLMTGAKRLENW